MQWEPKCINDSYNQAAQKGNAYFPCTTKKKNPQNGWGRTNDWRLASGFTRKQL